MVYNLTKSNILKLQGGEYMRDINIGIRLRQLRLEKGLGQIEIAKLLDVDVSTVSGYELNKRKIEVDKLVTLAEFYNVTLDSLVGKGPLLEKVSSSPGKTGSIYVATSEELDFIKGYSKLPDSWKMVVKSIIETVLSNVTKK
jgi:transcriptional regulator with XRE-family HTH domain